MSRQSKLSKLTVDALLGVLVTLVLIGLFELALAGFGAGDAQGDLDVSRGFDPHGVYFVPDPEVAGGLRTRFLDGEQEQIPPKGDRKRVILVGGSNTRSFRHRDLEVVLNQSASSLRYEVINVGRKGYGSTRVAILLEHALEHLEPDVVVIYSGHNEFVERGFLLDVGTQWAGGTLFDSLARTRTVRLLAHLFEETDSQERSDPGEAWKNEYAKFAGLTYDGTLECYEDYRENLRRMCRAVLDHGAGVVLCTVIHNRFAAPFVSTLPAGATTATRKELEALRAEATAKLPAFLDPLLPEKEQDRVHAYNWSRGRGEVPNPKERAARVSLRPSTGALAGMNPGWPAPERWTPIVWQMLASLERLYSRRVDDAERAGLVEAERLLSEALALCPDHPRTLFELGLVELLLERDEARVAERFELAARYDRAPRKANGATNDVVREVAAEIPGVTFLDADRLFAERVPMGLVGWEWMVDHCHVNLGARRALMRDFAQVIVATWP